MNIKYRTLSNGKIEASIEGSYITGIGIDEIEAVENLKKWLDIMGNIKWIDVITGQEVKEVK